MTLARFPSVPVQRGGKRNLSKRYEDGGNRANAISRDSGERPATNYGTMSCHPTRRQLMPKHYKKSIFKPVIESEKKLECTDKKGNITVKNEVNITVKQENDDGCTGCFKALFSALKG